MALEFPATPWQVLRPLQAALPLRLDFWPTLALGFRHSTDRISHVIAEWQAQGIVAGVQGEWNPGFPGAREWLEWNQAPPADRNASRVLRWSAVTRDRRVLTSWLDHGQSGPLPPAAFPAVAFRRCGWFVDGSGPKVLDPQDDRTGRVFEDEAPPPLRADQQTSLVADYFSRPVPLDPALSPWELAAASLDLQPPQVLAKVRELLNARAWRRFAVRVNPGAAGLRGCGLAAWNLAPEDLDGASRALAQCHGVGDVVIRRSTSDWAANLCGVFVARGPGEGEAAAQHAARQWNRPLASWVDLEFP